MKLAGNKRSTSDARVRKQNYFSPIGTTDKNYFLLFFIEQIIAPITRNFFSTVRHIIHIENLIPLNVLASIAILVDCRVINHS